MVILLKVKGKSLSKDLKSINLVYLLQLTWLLVVLTSPTLTWSSRLSHPRMLKHTSIALVEQQELEKQEHA